MVNVNKSTNESISRSDNIIIFLSFKFPKITSHSPRIIARFTNSEKLFQKILGKNYYDSSVNKQKTGKFASVYFLEHNSSSSYAAYIIWCYDQIQISSNIYRALMNVVIRKISSKLRFDRITAVYQLK